MPSIVYCLLFLFFTNILFEPTTCALPEYLQNIEFDDITSLWDKFPSIIGQIKQAVNRFRCPKGWRRLGGSCYYLSNLTSTSFEANSTCNQLHSNHSNLMQIRNTVELFYAAHILTKYNLSALMIEIDPNLLKGKTMTDILMDDQGRWQRMKEKFREIRIRYYKIKDKVIRELESAGLRISQRSKKIKQTIKRKKQKYDMYDDYDYIENIINRTNDTFEVDEYEYENLDEEEDDNEFERLDDISGICDQIDWNVLDSNTTVYMLTTFLIDDKIVCSISNIEQDLEYEHLCEYVLDFCFANVICGKYGRCVNTLSGFKCSCSFLYGGVLCEKISKQGKQIIAGIIIIIVLYGLSFKPIRWLLFHCITGFSNCFKLRTKKMKWKKAQKEKDDQEELVNEKKIKESQTNDTRRATIVEDIMEFIMPKQHPSIQNPNKRDLSRLVWVGGLTIIFLSLLLSLSTINHFSSFKYNIVNHTQVESLLNDTIRLVAKCGSISNYRTENIIFFPIAVAMIFIFSWSIKREKKCLSLCDGRPGLIPPIEPFRTGNRLTTATVFGILAFEVLKIFEELLFASADPFNRGILIELIERIALIVLIGLRYYPVLASLQLRNIAVRFFTCLYMIADIIYTIIREGSCMGYLPLAKYYAPLEEAKLRMELGTWFIVYGLVKNTPHFCLLSYITAELCVRVFYDSIYVPCKKNQSIWLAPVAQPDEYAFSKFYVTRLFRRNVHTTRQANIDDVDIDDLIDYEHENNLQKKRKPSKIKKYLNEIYIWNDDFRFTTIATCTYTVAVVFLYYLACTLVFLYTSRTAGHISFIRHYIESTLNVEFKGFFSLRSTIFWSALITFTLYVYQLFLGMKNYKKHKLQLLRGIYEDVPSSQNFKANSMAAKSVHYSGFLVGYMAWGFVICFHLIFFIMIIIHIVSLQIRYFEIILAFTVPVFVVYLLKMVSISSAGKFFFIQDAEEKLNLKNRKVYAIFVYFNFFADCFLGIASCIIRLCKATFLNIVYMARLDCSFLGRPLEKFDLGFAAYVSYLHMEVTHTNPIMLAFCYSLYEDVVKRRPKHCYDDECCIAPGELEDEEIYVERKTSITKNNRVVPEKKPEPITEEEEEDDDDDGLSVKEEIKPKSKSKSPSIISDKSSQRSKQKKSSIDEDESQPVVSVVARLIPELQPRLPPISPEPPPVPKRRDIPSENDEDEDDDGGIKPETISTIEKIIPQEPPRLLPIQRSSPPTAKNKDKNDDDDEDDDGGMASRKSTPPKKEPVEKKKKTPVKKDDDEEDDDDDGGVKPPSISTISKIMPKKQPHLLPFQNASAPPRPSPPKVPQRQDIPTTKGNTNKNDDDDDEDDGGINPKVIAKQREEAEKKKKKKEEETKKKKQIAAADDDGFDDDGGVNPKTKKPKEKKTKSQSKVPLIFEDEDDDGGISKEKRQAEQKKKQELEAKKKEKEQTKKKIQQDKDDDEDGAPKDNQSKKKSKSTENKKPTKPEYVKEDDEDDDGGRIVKNYDTIRKIMSSKQPVLNRESKSKSPEPTQREPLLKSIDIVGRLAVPAPTEDNHYDTIPTDEERTARAQAIYSPPSYTKATADTNESFPLRSTSYREAQETVPVTTKKSSIRSRSTINEDSSHYSEVTNGTISSGIVNRSYSHSGSIKKQSKPKQEQQIEESEVESEQEELVKKKPTKKTLTSLPNISTAHQTLNYLVKPKEAPKIQEVARKRVARFRWFLAYTIINNYHLFDLRKQVQSRLARLRISRSNLYDEEKHAADAAVVATVATVPTVQVEPSKLRERKAKVASVVSDVSAVPITNRRLLSVPVPVIDDYPQSPAERYVAIRSAMLYDVNAQQSDTSRSQGTSATSQQVRFKGAPTVVVQSPSESSTKSKRPLYQRQETEVSDPFCIEQLGGTPMFQGIPESLQSTADYPLANGSSITNFSTLRTQMSHAQHMQAWRHEQLKKLQKKRPHCYHYGAPLQKPLEEKVATAAILTPQIIEPQKSPFQYPRQIQTINEKQSKPKIQSSSSSTVTNINANDNKQDSPVQKKAIRATSSIVQRKDSSNSFSNVTEV